MKKTSLFLFRAISSVIFCILKLPPIRNKLLTLAEKMLATASADTRNQNKRMAAISVACWIYHKIFTLLRSGELPTEGITIEEQLRTGLVICLTVQKKDPRVGVSWGYWPGNEEIIRDAEHLAGRMLDMAHISHKFEGIEQKK